MKVLPEHPLARKVAIVTAIKLMVLLALWWTFFRSPHESSMTPEQVGNAILHPNHSSIPKP